MSDTFTASDGVTLVESGNAGFFRVGHGGQSWAGISEEWVPALREFFLHEAGIWRDPETGALVTRETHADDPDGRSIGIIVDGGFELHWERLIATDKVRAGIKARYFAAHPEPRPWHDARNGQLWLIRFSDFPDTDVSALVKNDVFMYNDDCHEGTAALDDTTIVGGTQLWPEVTP